MDNIYFLKLMGNSFTEEEEKLISLLSEEKREKIKNLRQDIDKKLSLYAELVLRLIICKSLNLKNDELSFGKTEFGKPYLRGDYGFEYNISHTHNALIIGVSDKKIGVDIEKEKAEKSHMDIAKRFFTIDEFNYISSSKNKVIRRFYEVWTKKEAYIKWIGKGLLIPLTSFNVFDMKLKNKIKTLVVDDYMISICSEKVFRTKNIVYLTEHDIGQDLMKII